MSYSLHHVHLLCSDLENTLSFFTDSLGAELIARRKFGGADGASLDLNGTMVNLRVAAEGETVTGDASKPTFGYHHLGLQVEDIDAAHRDLVQQGFTFVKEPTTLPDNSLRIAFFTGPDSITFELLQSL